MKWSVRRREWTLFSFGKYNRCWSQILFHRILKISSKAQWELWTTNRKNDNYWQYKEQIKLSNEFLRTKFSHRNDHRVSVSWVPGRRWPQAGQAWVAAGQRLLLLAMLDPSPVSVSHISQCHASSQNLYYQSIQSRSVASLASCLMWAILMTQFRLG